MRKKFAGIIFPVIILVTLLSACSGARAAATQTPTAAPSATPDPCGPGQIEAQVEKVNRHMREFDDAAFLASNTPGPQLGPVITTMQNIRREADAEAVPPCLANLKTYQIRHMNSVINTLSAFISGSDQQTLDQGIRLARQQHDDYARELARVLGLTVVPANPIEVSAPSETPTP